MKRLVGVLVPAVLFVPVAMHPSQAAVSREIVRGLAGLEENSFPPFEVSCDDPAGTEGAPTTTLSVVRQPAVQAHGLRSLRLAPPVGKAQGLSSMVNSAMTTYGVKVYTAAELPAVGTVRIQFSAEPGIEWVGRASWTQPASPSWQSVDVLAISFLWTSYENGVEVGSGGDSALGSFLQSKAGDDVAYGDLRVAFGCTGQPFHLDGLTFAVPGIEPLYDIEADDTTETSIWNGSDVATATMPLTVRAQVRGHWDVLPGVPVHLEERAYGSSTFKRIATTTTGAKGVAAVDVKPMRAATYRWIVDHTTAYDGSRSGLFPVKVKTKVTSVVADSTVRVGQTIVLTGRTTPVKAGYAFQLYREYSPDGGLIKTGTTRSDGTYRVTYVPRKAGKYVLAVSVAGGEGNIRSVSPMRTVTVTN
ncbi:MAG TPA: hypothetical protein VFK52_12195 [Nocardioidaceae bacterium]|nr:hypothetical protein [Nocardioidaceae bacterium]